MNEKRNSKSYEEIYKEKYPYKEISGNPLQLTEAMGYLKALEEFLPSANWIAREKTNILVILMLKLDIETEEK